MVRGQRSEENHRTGPLMTEWSRKVSPSLTSLISAATFGWWVRIWCERHENIDPFCLVSSAWSASGVIVVVVGEMSMSHFELLRTIWSLFSLPEFWWPDQTQTLPFLTTVDHLLMDTLQQDDSPGHKAPAISYWFLSVSVHWTLDVLHSQLFSVQENLWEQEMWMCSWWICNRSLQSKNLWGMFVEPCWIHKSRNEGSSEDKRSRFSLVTWTRSSIILIRLIQLTFQWHSQQKST